MLDDIDNIFYLINLNGNYLQQRKILFFMLFKTVDGDLIKLILKCIFSINDVIKSIELSQNFKQTNRDYKKKFLILYLVALFKFKNL